MNNVAYPEIRGTLPPESGWMGSFTYPQIWDSLTPELKAKFQLVPTRYVGIHAVRAAVCYLTPRVETAFPRGALIVIHKYAGIRHIRREAGIQCHGW